jgi:hypothetical protein
MPSLEECPAPPHHHTRNLEQLESNLVEAGADDAHMTSRDDRPASEEVADFLAKIEMGVFGHP